MAIQNYYTKKPLAADIASHVSIWQQSVLDLCAGSGHLSLPLLSSGKARSVTFIEPDGEASTKLQKLVARKKHVQLFAMTAEEYACTYASPASHEVVICNPLFGKRVGRTSLDELVTDLHLPEVQHFESYFLRVASVLASSNMIFILPASYFRQEEARSTFSTLADHAWQLTNLAELPLDGFHNATVRTYLLIFKKSPGYVDTWPNDLRDLSQGDIPLFHNKGSRGVHQARYGTIEGYCYPKEKSKSYDFSSWYSRSEELWPATPTTPFWQPVRRQLGEIWVRMGCAYELTANGWQPATCKGYLNGQPVDADIDLAKQAFQLLRLGAHASAAHLVSCLEADVKDLQAKVVDHPEASFLGLLPDAKCDAMAISKDLAKLGLIAVPKALDAHFDLRQVVRLGCYLVNFKKLNQVQRAHLFTEGLLTQAQALELYEVLRGTTIPIAHTELRAAWIPKALIAKYLDVKIDPRGFFENPHSYSCPLTAYLNYGKVGARIQETDVAYYEQACNAFAIFVNHWNGFNKLQLLIHAHWLLRQTSSQKQSGKIRDLKPALPMHPFQREDLPFALSGQAILNWDVGLGKTFGGISAAKAHYGQALIVVPKPVISKWVREIHTFYPGTSFAVLGFRQNKAEKYVLHMKGLAEQAREVFFETKPELILTTHQVFARLKLSERTMRSEDIQDAFDQRGSETTRSGNLQREKFIRLAAERNFLFGGELTFTDLPLASLLIIVDEGHQFKSLFPMPSSGWGQSLVMAGNCGESKRARDMKIKLDLVRNAGGKTLCLTATPISNSVAEIFNMLRIYAPAGLKKRGIASTEALIDTYCTFKSVTTVSVSGTVVHGQTIAGFRNLEDLRAMWSEVMVTRLGADEGLQLPQEREHVIRVEPTAIIHREIRKIKAKLGRIAKKADGRSRKIGAFEVIAALDKITLFPPMVGLPDNPKGETLAAKVFEIYQSTDGGQIVFSDQLESQEGLKALLMRRGIPEHEIGIINANTTPKIDDRLRYQDAFNCGTLRVIIGGAIASEGIDLQKNTAAIHFNNLNWHGQEIHQRKGRAIRQGNKRKVVDVFYYLLEGTTDIYRMATTASKTSWWEALRSSQTETSKATIFSDPVSDELIASLANNPDDVLAELTDLRRTEEIKKELTTFKNTLKQVALTMEPGYSASHLLILRSFETKLKQYTWIPKEYVTQGIQRAAFIATLRSKTFKQGCRSQWPKYMTQNITQYFDDLPYASLDRILTLEPNGADTFQWHLDLDKHLKPIHRPLLAKAMTTFIPSEPPRDPLLISGEAKDPKAPRKKPTAVIEIQLSLFPGMELTA